MSATIDGAAVTRQRRVAMFRCLVLVLGLIVGRCILEVYYCWAVSTSTLRRQGPTPVLSETVNVSDDVTLRRQVLPAPVINEKVNVSKYVYHIGTLDGRGLGNLLMAFAAVVYAAELAGRRPAMLKVGDGFASLRRPLDLDRIERFDDLRPCYGFNEKASSKYDARIEDVARPDNPSTRGKSIALLGYFFCWKYTRGIEHQLRRDHLVFRSHVRKFVDDFFERRRPPTWTTGGFVRVGVHVRRGDFLTPNGVAFGYTVPTPEYFQNAMRYFVERHERVQFFLCSNDWTWTKQNVVAPPAALSVNGSSVDLTYARDGSRDEDFAILSNCDHVIMSTGSFGWWAAWMANGTTIFYKNWRGPARGSPVKSITKTYFRPVGYRWSRIAELRGVLQYLLLL